MHPVPADHEAERQSLFDALSSIGKQPRPLAPATLVRWPAVTEAPAVSSSMHQLASPEARAVCAERLLRSAISGFGAKTRPVATAMFAAEPHYEGLSIGERQALLERLHHVTSNQWADYRRTVLWDLVYALRDLSPVVDDPTRGGELTTVAEVSAYLGSEFASAEVLRRHLDGETPEFPSAPPGVFIPRRAYEAHVHFLLILSRFLDRPTRLTAEQQSSVREAFLMVSDLSARALPDVQGLAYLYGGWRFSRFSTKLHYADLDIHHEIKDRWAKWYARQDFSGAENDFQRVRRSALKISEALGSWALGEFEEDVFMRIPVWLESVAKETFTDAVHSRQLISAYADVPILGDKQELELINRLVVERARLAW